MSRLKDDLIHLGRKERMILELSIVLGNRSWDTFQKSPVGVALLELLPNDEVRERAAFLYMCGFGGRFAEGPRAIHPERVGLELDWADFLGDAHGKIVLDGDEYPDTPDEVLNAAKAIFAVGRQSASEFLSEKFGS